MMDTILQQLANEYNMPLEEIQLRLIRQLSKKRENTPLQKGGEIDG